MGHGSKAETLAPSPPSYLPRPTDLVSRTEKAAPCPGPRGESREEGRAPSLRGSDCPVGLATASECPPPRAQEPGRAWCGAGTCGSAGPPAWAARGAPIRGASAAPALGSGDGTRQRGAARGPSAGSAVPIATAPSRSTRSHRAPARFPQVLRDLKFYLLSRFVLEFSDTFRNRATLAWAGQPGWGPQAGNTGVPRAQGGPRGGCGAAKGARAARRADGLTQARAPGPRRPPGEGVRWPRSAASEPQAPEARAGRPASPDGAVVFAPHLGRILGKTGGIYYRLGARNKGARFPRSR